MGALVSVRPPRRKHYVADKWSLKKKKEKKIHSVKLALNPFPVFVFPFESIEMKLLECDAD